MSLVLIDYFPVKRAFFLVTVAKCLLIEDIWIIEVLYLILQGVYLTASPLR